MPLNHKQEKNGLLELPCRLKLGLRPALLVFNSSTHSYFNHTDKLSSLPTAVSQIKVGNHLHLSNGMIVPQSYMSKQRNLKKSPIYVNKCRIKIDMNGDIPIPILIHTHYRLWALHPWWWKASA